MKTKSRWLFLLMAVVLLGVSSMALADMLYTPGTYTAAARGNGGDVNVEVTFDESSIVSVVVREHQETPGISDAAIERLPDEIVKYQSLGMDAVSGATLTSNAILTAVADCVAQANGDIDALKAVKITAESADLDLEADLVVVGAGASGLSAAITAAENGLNVVLFEKQASAGGEAILSGGIIYAAGAKAQIERGLTDDTPEALAEYWMSVEPDANYDLVLKIAEKSGSTVDWIESMGVEFDPVLKAQGLDKVDRGLTSANQAGGFGLINPLVERVNAMDQIQLLLETRGEEILMDEDGKVCGATAIRNDGSHVKVSAPAVILCTNSIDSSPELIEEYHPGFGKYASTNPMKTGDGHIMARNVGAKIIAYTHHFVGAIMPISGLQINAKGDRFTNESGFYNIIWSDLLETTGDIDNMHPIMIMDTATMESSTLQFPMQDGKLYTWAQLIEKGFDRNFKFATAANGVSYKADTLEELAGMINVPYENLKASVDRYNELCDIGEDLDFGKDAKYLYKIEKGPFYAYDEGLMVTYFSAGIAVDLDMRVLREDGSVIPGLYAAGFCAAEDFKPNQYPGSGAAIAYGLNSGRIAAENVASDLKK